MRVFPNPRAALFFCALLESYPPAVLCQIASTLSSSAFPVQPSNLLSSFPSSSYKNASTSSPPSSPNNLPSTIGTPSSQSHGWPPLHPHFSPPRYGPHATEGFVSQSFSQDGSTNRADSSMSTGGQHSPPSRFGRYSARNNSMSASMDSSIPVDTSNGTGGTNIGASNAINSISSTNSVLNATEALNPGSTTSDQTNAPIQTSMPVSPSSSNATFPQSSKQRLSSIITSATAIANFSNQPSSNISITRPPSTISSLSSLSGNDTSAKNASNTKMCVDYNNRPLPCSCEGSHTSWKPNLPIIAPTNDCGLGCLIDASYVQIIYWPIAIAAPNATGINITAPPATTPYTLISDGFTFISPSVYVRYLGLKASAAYLPFGLPLGNGSHNVTVGYDPSALSTSHCYHDASATNQIYKAVNYTELQIPPANGALTDCGSAQNVPTLSVAAQSPFFSMPGKLNWVDPAWRTCLPVTYGVFDPPTALAKESALVAPTATPAGKPVPETAPATATPPPAAPETNPAPAPRPVAKSMATQLVPDPPISFTSAQTPAATPAAQPQTTPTDTPANTPINQPVNTPANQPANTPANSPANNPQNSANPAAPAPAPQAPSPANNPPAPAGNAPQAVNTPANTPGNQPGKNNSPQGNSGNTGTGNTGNGNNGNGNTGSGDGNGNTGTGNTANDNGNSGNGNTGNTGNTGNGNAGSGNSGSGNGGNGNSGNGNSGNGNEGNAAAQTDSNAVVMATPAPETIGLNKNAATPATGQGAVVAGGNKNGNPAIPATGKGAVVAGSGQTPGGDNQIIQNAPKYTFQPKPSPVEIGGQSVATAPGGGVVIGSSIYTPGQQAEISGTKLSVGKDNIAVNGATHALPALPSQTAVDIGGNPITRATNGGLVVGSKTIAPGQSATISGQVISAGPSNAVVDGKSYALPSSAGAVLSQAPDLQGNTPETQAPVVVNGKPVAKASNGDLVLGGKTVALGQESVVAGHTISVAPNDKSAVVDGSTVGLSNVPAGSALQTPAPAQTEGQKLVVVDGQKVSKLANGDIAIGSTTLTPGASMKVGDHMVSVAPNDTSVVLDGSTLSLPSNRFGGDALVLSTPTPFTSAHASPVLIGGQSITRGPSNDLVIGTHTLHAGGTSTIAGHVIADNGGNIIIDGKNYALPSSSGGTLLTVAAPSTITPGHRGSHFPVLKTVNGHVVKDEGGGVVDGTSINLGSTEGAVLATSTGLGVPTDGATTTTSPGEITGGNAASTPGGDGHTGVGTRQRPKILLLQGLSGVTVVALACLL